VGADDTFILAKVWTQRLRQLKVSIISCKW
jgi:hypothetical protein